METTTAEKAKGMSLAMSPLKGDPSGRISMTVAATAACMALMLAAGACFGVSFSPTDYAAGVGACLLCALLPSREGEAAAAVLAAASLASLLIHPALRAGAQALCNSLYARSESVNEYTYRYFDPAGTPGAEKAALVAAAIVIGAFSVLAARRRVIGFAALVGVSFFEAYFGVTAGGLRDLLLFAILAALAVRGGSGSDRLLMLAAFAAAAVAICLLFPARNEAVELRSEQMRDELGLIAMNITDEVPRISPDSSYTREESRLREEHADEGDRDGEIRGFEKETVTEKEISLPHRFDILKAALWGLLSLLVIVLPFLPFLIVSRERRLKAHRRAEFSDPENAAAIRAMFSHTVEWMHRAGLDTGNRLYSQYGELVGAVVSPECAERYRKAVQIWQEAAYSGHTMSDEQRREVQELLDMTSSEIYAKAGKRARFKMRYIDCLCGSRA